MLYTIMWVSSLPDTHKFGFGSFFLSHLTPPWTTSCKVARSLFRYHLHINTARELAGQHLMRGWQYFMIFFFLILIFYLIFSYPLGYCFKGTLWQGSQILDKGWGWRITNICKICYLHIKCFSANSLAVLMWRWYLNSVFLALQLLHEDL